MDIQWSSAVAVISNGHQAVAVISNGHQAVAVICNGHQAVAVISNGHQAIAADIQWSSSRSSGSYGMYLVAVHANRVHIALH